MRAALLSYSARVGDALGNLIAEKLAFFLDRGADVRVFIECERALHPSIRPHAHVLSSVELDGAGWKFLAAADLVIVDYSQHYSLLGLLPLLADARPRIILDYHGVTPPELWGSQQREALEKGVRQRGLVWCADAALVHSRFTQQELRLATGYPASRLFSLGYPLDTEYFQPGPPARSLRDELGIGQATLLLYVGRLAPNKRSSMLVEAVAQLSERTPPVHAVIVGDDTDVYAEQAQLCRQRAEELGVTDRVHLLGRLDESRLLDAYRSADVFVMPSRHEGFCLPVIEAMSCGVPVVAARATALPETVASAGLTFAADDPNDLCRQLRRVLTTEPVSLDTSHSPLRIGIVSFRYGPGVLGGAEHSLRTIAGALRGAGHQVEVFTTCTVAENDWSDQLPAGTVELDGLPVHRFRLDPHDRARHLESARLVSLADGPVSDELEDDYLRHSIHSTPLVEELRRRQEEFDAIIVGPYLFGLSWAVATAMPYKTLLLPCFHDEAFARLRRLQQSYDLVSGILYHSTEEQHFAEAVLGFNHPGATLLGTLLDCATAGDPSRGSQLVGAERYVVYAGRYSQQKDVLTLLNWAERASAEYPGQFRFAFLGQGEVTIPSRPWVCDLGILDEAEKRDVLAGAAALVQLSRRESLSLVALEAWAQGTPVIANCRCDVLVGHLERCQGGRAVDSYDEFVLALQDLWHKSISWVEAGYRGQEYVRKKYGSRSTFVQRLETAIREMNLPLVEQMRRQGRQRAQSLTRDSWRQQFAQIAEAVLDLPPRASQVRVEVRPRVEQRMAQAGSPRLLLPVRVVNLGTTVVAHEGPGRSVIRSFVLDRLGRCDLTLVSETPLPALLLPERALAAAATVTVPRSAGPYRVVFRIGRADHSVTPADVPDDFAAMVHLDLVVEGVSKSNGVPPQPLCSPLLEGVQAALVEADRRQRLPDGYRDVTEGWLAPLKHWIKRKLLGNFQRAYVDVLARQQTAFNQQLLIAVAELAECCATLQHVEDTKPTVANERAQLQHSLADVRQLLTELNARLAQLEEAERLPL